MPSTRRRPAPRRGQGVRFLNPDQRLRLMFGTRFFAHDDQPAFEDADHERAAWAIHGSRLTAEFTERFPGRRPAAWERYGSPDQEV